MLGVTRLLTGTLTPGDVIRYGNRDSRQSPAHMLHYTADKRPVVVWNVTRRCNLHCVHCYANSFDRDFPNELSHEEALRVIDGLAEFKIPTVLFSGGEPTLRKDLFDLADAAAARGIRCVLSTNGTQIDEAMADRIKASGFSYVGVSIDGLREVHDRHRGYKGAFDEALRGIRLCRERDIRVGLRFTISKLNFRDLSQVLDLLETEDIPRCCVYHLAYAGRGKNLSNKDLDLTHEETRFAVQTLFDKAEYFHAKGMTKDILTVDNHADAIFLYERIRERDPKRAADVLELLSWNGGNQSGVAVASIDFTGEVHADQFSMHYSFGNVRDRKFGDIWTDDTIPVLAALKDRKKYLNGRCGACKYLSLCNGNLRVRAESALGDMWAPDPACYLTDEEIGYDPEKPHRAIPGPAPVLTPEVIMKGR